MNRKQSVHQKYLGPVEPASGSIVRPAVARQACEMARESLKASPYKRGKLRAKIRLFAVSLIGA